MADEEKTYQHQPPSTAGNFDPSRLSSLPSVEISTPRAQHSSTDDKQQLVGLEAPIPGVDNPAFDSLEREGTHFERRTPRYQSGQFCSYEEMLARMDENNDPFTGEPPHPSKSYDPDLPDRWRSEADGSEPKPLTSREKSKIYDQDVKKRKKKKKRKPREEHQDPLEGTYTLDRNERRGESGSAPTNRKGSGKSNGTYVLDSDQKKLIDSELARTSCVDMSVMSSPKAEQVQVLGQTNTGYSTGKIKTVMVDAREQRHHIHGTGQMDEVRLSLLCHFVLKISYLSVIILFCFSVY